MSYDPFNRDTIAAIATSNGRAGIGIVRMSGPGSIEIAERIFRPNRPLRQYESHRLHLGRLIDPASDEMIDEVLLSCMRTPNSYTREDVIEINSHSGPILLEKILAILIAQGARLAAPGEFTFRAFVNGRIDLTQAEAVMDIINVRSEKGLVLSSGQISGELGERISVLRENIIGLLASVEVAIDYPDEESEHVSGEESARQLEKEIIAPIKEIISAHARRKAWVEGISTAIVGRVNAGKSSLLNRLSNEQRSIVTSIPGTTRDIIESTLYIKGLPLRLMDTAGIREGNDEVEKIGIRLSEQKLAEADLALAVIDRSRPLDHNDRRVLSMLNRDNSIIIINKTDLPSGLDEALLYELANGMPIAPISVLTGNGVEHLCDLIVDKALENEMDTGFEKLAPNLRHKKALCEAAEYFEQAAQNLKKGAPMEIISVDLKAGLDHLGEITGATTNEELYDRIFSQFCLGK